MSKTELYKASKTSQPRSAGPCGHVLPVRLDNAECSTVVGRGRCVWLRGITSQPAIKAQSKSINQQRQHVNLAPITL